MKWLTDKLRKLHRRNVTFPRHVRNLRSPDLLIELVTSNRWPADLRLDTSSLVAESGLSFLDHVDVTVFGNTQILEKEDAGLVKFAEYDMDKNIYPDFPAANVAFGSKSLTPVKLPLLDVEKAFAFGTGADWGDDLYLCLDYRTDPDDPRVVCNEKTDDGDVWHLLSPTFSEFCICIGLTDNSWRKGRYGEGSKYSAFYYEGR